MYKVELIVLSNRIQEAIALQYFMKEILQISNTLTNIYCNNQVVIKSIKVDKTKYSTQTKYIGLWHNFIKCYIEEQLINIKYVQTDKQIADIFTKALQADKFTYLRKELGMIDKNMIEKEVRF